MNKTKIHTTVPQQHIFSPVRGRGDENAKIHS